jgi:6,7-dimethyl-8-ribityllumazine synthase
MSMDTIRGLKLHPAADASDMHFAVIKTRWNTQVVDALVGGCIETLRQSGCTQITVEEVGGAFELPLAASVMSAERRFDAIIPIGCLIKGETMHFEYISQATVNGLMQVGLETKIPVIDGVLNVLSETQALERAGLVGSHGNEGIGWAQTAIQQVKLIRKYRA